MINVWLSRESPIQYYIKTEHCLSNRDDSSYAERHSRWARLNMTIYSAARGKEDGLCFTWIEAETRSQGPLRDSVSR